MFDKILIANRGEIACRVIRTCRKLGIRSVAVYSDADADAQHVKLADEALHIGAAAPGESYLRIDAVIAAARSSGAQAVHPGYGFLSENADFADAVEAAGLVFIGPSAASMRKMGSKAGAKELMKAHGVPVVPGYTGEDQEAAHLQREADAIGYPLMIKAAHGGGGKGMRIVRTSSEFTAALQSCQREAKNAFGRDRVLLERYIERPRHIEIQVFADAQGHTLHLNERECSAQRRYQKVIEESPSPFLSQELRTQMGQAAVQAAKAIDYRNAGTVEFIVGADGGFYFMEINTRLQVEHPVTEMVTGFDLVEWQLRVAAGEALPMTQSEIPQRGHAIEVRLYAEDPEAGFLPGSGHLQSLRLPQTSEHVRVDAGVVQGDTVTIHYDPMIAKLIVHDVDRPRALARLREALADCDIRGPKSNIAFLERLIRHPVVVQGEIDTSYLDKHLDEVLGDAKSPDATQLAMAAAIAALSDEHDQPNDAYDPTSPWRLMDGWRLGHAGERLLRLGWREQRFDLGLRGFAGEYRVRVGADDIAVRVLSLHDGRSVLDCAGRTLNLRAFADATRVHLHDGERRIDLERLPRFATTAEDSGSGDDRLRAPMPGKLVVLKVGVGETVKAGQELAVMEAMKMELALKSPRDGIVQELRFVPGDFIEADGIIVMLEPISA